MNQFHDEHDEHDEHEHDDFELDMEGFELEMEDVGLDMEDFELEMEELEADLELEIETSMEDAERQLNEALTGLDTASNPQEAMESLPADSAGLTLLTCGLG